MSKIGRKPIKITTAEVAIDGKNLTLKGPKGKFVHTLSDVVSAEQKDGELHLSVTENTRKSRTQWGLDRALLSNKIIGVEKGFEKKVKIVGLGYKAQASGSKLIFSLGYSHKIDYTMPEGVTVDIDKSGQNLTFKAIDKFVLGNVCDAVRMLRLPEPYKGTGIIREGDVIIRKAGKTKA